MSEKVITLPQLLRSRDVRHERQLEYLGRYPGKTLVVLTIVMPGSVKRNQLSLAAAKAAVTALLEAFCPTAAVFDTFDLETGYETFIMTSMSQQEAKRTACDIEDTHPLGRLFDIDVFGDDRRPISRTFLGLPGRKCLVCGDDARVCMRLGRHSYDDLTRTIADMIESYERNEL